MSTTDVRTIKRFRVVVIAAVIVATAHGACAKPIRVRFDDLVTTPNRFNGKEVSVVGYYDQKQTHAGGFICSDAQAFRVLMLKRVPQIFIDLKRAQLMNASVKVIDRGYVRVMGTFQYRNTEPKVVRRDPGEKDAVIVQGTVGFGWMGVYSMQITDIKEFTPLEAR